jgi:Heterokaryon incompatibility protein (HET)
MVETYLYKPIRTPRTIRIFKLHPASASNFNTALKGSLKELALPEYSLHDYLRKRAQERGVEKKADLEEAVKVEISNEFSQNADVHFGKHSFSAVSHAWETGARPSIPLLIDGRTLMITANVDSALRNLRATGKTRRLWIDAICINPTSLQEKNEQAELAGDIFKIANEVIVWLGAASDEDNKTFKRKSRKFPWDKPPGLALLSFMAFYPQLTGKPTQKHRP